MQYLYAYQQQKHITLMDILTQVCPEFPTFPFHLWDIDESVVYSITDSGKT